MLTQNSKLKKNNIWAFSLPAGKTCPQAGACALGCYAKQGFYNMPSVSRALERNLLESRSPSFKQSIQQELDKKDVKILRIHASGDFYNLKYLKDWIEIARRNPHVKFYAYTKMVLMVKMELQRLIQKNCWVESLPKNLVFIFSEGGKQDSMIAPSDRHSRVFASAKELKAAGYTDASKQDVNAFGDNPKVGLIYHGSRAKKWTTQ